MLEAGENQISLSAILGCSQGFVSRLLAEKNPKFPGLTIAHAIEEATKDWSEGAIDAADWIPAHPVKEKKAPESKPARKKKAA